MALRRHDIDLLLGLTTDRQDIKDGWWFKIVAQEDPGEPDGIRYSLTLHRNDGARVLGFDNAHGRHHRHTAGGAERPYSFTTCTALLDKFFDDIDSHLHAIGVLP
jgi:hypothetical protein